MNEQTVGILLQCQHCDHSETVVVARSALRQWQRGEGQVQQIFPGLSRDQRELLISRTCGKCFDEITSPTDWSDHE